MLHFKFVMKFKKKSGSGSSGSGSSSSSGSRAEFCGFFGGKNPSTQCVGVQGSCNLCGQYGNFASVCPSAGSQQTVAQPQGRGGPSRGRSQQFQQPRLGRLDCYLAVPGSDQFLEETSLHGRLRKTTSIRSTTGYETPSSACTIRPDEIGVDGFSSSSWPEQIPATRSGGRRRRWLV
ncbi:hypothetical protein F511_33368 [Dorcoceras hygrometricum]|uniref:CCHC-type domain-containing protein n=1 Tax=Dorcoceras hygrometricum TaxID=472368 RepID=A0A2Z7BD28_9LAMI|nr:hypothetical protein F511_33368 [Dorcoceras hygrometricum]